jgi:hypothetical protein
MAKKQAAKAVMRKKAERKETAKSWHGRAQPQPVNKASSPPPVSPTRAKKPNHPGCPRQSMRIGHPSRKRLGEASEAAFVARGIGFNFPVAKLWGESDPCDTLVGFGFIHWRVQVKCAQSCVDGKYKVKGGGLNHNYTKHEIDFLAAHIVPENIWYIIPVEAFQGRRMLCFRPDGRGERKYEKYREAWCLLACAPEDRGPQDIPQQCRCQDLPVRCAVCPKK